MVEYKDFIASGLVGKRVHVMCDCIVPLDVTGMVSSYEISSNEIIYYINTGGKLIKVGENTPKLKIELL